MATSHPAAVCSDGARAIAQRPWRRARRLRDDERGWTLMELMVACSMFAILAGIAVPQYRAVALQMRTSAGANQVLSDLTFAREMAQRTGIPHYVQVSGTSYFVRREANPPAVNPGTDPVVRSYALGQRLPGVTFALNGATADPYGSGATAPTPGTPLVFNARGLPNVPGAYFVASSNGAYSHSVSVTGAGRIRLWTRVGSTWR